MKKILALLILVLIPFNVNAENDISKHKIGDIEIIAMKHSNFNHADELFILEDKTILGTKEATAASLNSFFINNGKNKILFDSGMDSITILSLLEQANIKPEEIDAVILTHMHGDHTGGMLNQEGKPNFANAIVFVAQEELQANKESIAAYGDKIKPFSENSEIIEGITSIPAFGHTVGHTIYMVESNGERLLIWGDLIHAVSQFKHPEIFMTYDNNPKQTLEIRQKILQQAAEEDLTIAGMHLRESGIGKIKKANIGYIFEPQKGK